MEESEWTQLSLQTQRDVCLGYLHLVINDPESYRKPPVGCINAKQHLEKTLPAKTTSTSKESLGSKNKEQSESFATWKETPTTFHFAVDRPPFPHRCHGQVTVCKPSMGAEGYRRLFMVECNPLCKLTP